MTVEGSISEDGESKIAFAISHTCSDPIGVNRHNHDIQIEESRHGPEGSSNDGRDSGTAPSTESDPSPPYSPLESKK